MVDVKLLKNMDNKCFTRIFDFLDKNFLKNKLIEYGKKQMKGSKYYIGSRMGSFWNGFSRLDKISDIKVKSFYKEEIKKNNEDVIDIFNNAILHKLNITDENIEELKENISLLSDVELATVLFQLFHIDSNITYEQYLLGKEKIIEKYEGKLKQSEEIYIRNISDLKDKIEENKGKVKQLLKELEEKNEILNKVEADKEKYFRLYKEQLDKNNLIINNLSSKGINITNVINSISNLIEESNVEILSQLKKTCLELLENNIINFTKDKDITDDLVIEYILIKIMEGVQNGNTNNQG